MEAVVGRRAHARRMPRWARRALIAVGVVVALAIAFRIVLDPLVERVMKKKLAELDGYSATFEGAHVTLFPPGIVVRRFKVIEQPGGDWEHPLAYVERTHMALRGRPLLRGHLVAWGRLDKPKISIVQEKKKQAEKKAERVPDLATQLEQAAPLQLERIEIVGGELLFRDETQTGKPEIWLHDLELAGENFATREALAEGRPTTMSARATLGKTGELTMFLSADPFAKGLTFAGRSALVGYDVRELAELIAAHTGTSPTSGTFDAHVEFRARDGAITGGVKPVLKNVEVSSADGKLWNRFKAWMADTTLDVFSDDVPGRHAVATIIPIKGKVDDPKAQVLPTALSVVRNAFVQAISSSFENLPPRTAPEKEGVIEQTFEALKKSEGPPEAQPEK